MPGRMPEDMPDRMPEDMPDKMPEDMSDRMPEDLPVTKRIDVMVGITRSKVRRWPWRWQRSCRRHSRWVQGSWCSRPNIDQGSWVNGNIPLHRSYIW